MQRKNVMRGAVALLVGAMGAVGCASWTPWGVGRAAQLPVVITPISLQARTHEMRFTFLISNEADAPIIFKIAGSSLKLDDGRTYPIEAANPDPKHPVKVVPVRRGEPVRVTVEVYPKDADLTQVTDAQFVWAQVLTNIVPVDKDADPRKMEYTGAPVTIAPTLVHRGD